MWGATTGGGWWRVRAHAVVIRGRVVLGALVGVHVVGVVGFPRVVVLVVGGGRVMKLADFAWLTLLMAMLQIQKRVLG